MSQKALMGHHQTILAWKKYGRWETLTNVKVNRKDVPTDEEIKQELEKAATFQSIYKRRRTQAIIALLETGKRRSEIASLKREDVSKDSEYLYVRFTVRKKRKKSENILQRTKKYLLTSGYAIMILRYLDYLDEKVSGSTYLFPAIRCCYGRAFSLDKTKPITGKQVWRIIKEVNSQDWPHLHRERRAVKVIRADEKKYGQANLETVYRIKTRLDLEREQTAYNYIRRHETQRVDDEEELL